MDHKLIDYGLGFQACSCGEWSGDGGDEAWKLHAAAAVWERLEAEPGFNEEMEQGRWDIAAGRGTPFREIRRSTTSDPNPTFRWPH